MENQLDSVTEKPTCFLRLQGLACDWSKHNKHSRNIFSVHGFLYLSVKVVKSTPVGALCDVFACKSSFAGVGFRKAEIDNTTNRQFCAKTRQVIL